jgi:hypothetical protein
MVMRPNRRPIHNMEGPVERPVGVRLLLQAGQDTVPDARLLPAIAATGDGFPAANAGGEIDPGGAGAQHPDDACEDEAVILLRAAGVGFLGWQQRLEPLPLRLGEFVSFHNVKNTTPAPSLQIRLSVEAAAV